ncbi:hypothetical protein SSABA_v1c01590 [Spiroplasma sabaudiense Ar-1343]|uniref:Lipoprotein n=1 Tax=Spiroplasma sabaudiense Ar-1343 TaxID=1276257 RepID=W6A9B4_9MOLU|nr:lipoprotein [Spiroplasma sabaudiense]AHI53571.1 hypothetical protein SSABA_v1c01590 [Spiroplasma sabaudiense Ar-1343]
MKKILSIVGSISLLTSSTISVVACQERVKPEEKLEFNKENVTNFFEENKEFTYEGDFIFISDPWEMDNEDFDVFSSTTNIIECLFVKTIIKEMSKNIDLNTNDFIQVVSILGTPSLKKSLGPDKYPKYDKNYVFTFDEVLIENTTTDEKMVFNEFKFNFKQTNEIISDKVEEKEIENLFSYWLGGINSEPSERFNWAKANDASFHEVADTLENGSLDDSKKEIKSGIEELSNSNWMGYVRTPIFEKYRFTVEIENVKLLPNKSEKLVFANISGVATFPNINNGQKANFSGNWGFWKKELVNKSGHSH